MALLCTTGLSFTLVVFISTVLFTSFKSAVIESVIVVISLKPGAILLADGVKVTALSALCNALRVLLANEVAESVPLEVSSRVMVALKSVESLSSSITAPKGVMAAALSVVLISLNTLIVVGFELISILITGAFLKL